jgi:hypothetical protein
MTHKTTSGLAPATQGSAQSWFDVGYEDGQAGKEPNPPEARMSVRDSYRAGWEQGYNAFINANWNK